MVLSLKVTRFPLECFGLVYWRDTSIIHHYDSIKGLNSKHAEWLATRLHLCLAPLSMALNIVEVECAQQTGVVACEPFFFTILRTLVK